MTRRGAAWLVLALLAAATAPACEREERRFRESPPASLSQPANAEQIRSSLKAGSDKAQGPNEANAFAMAEGQRLYQWFNCVGCHANGGGNIGPPLMDGKWIYGGDPASIYESIVNGRPNGMPAFHGKIPDAQVWELVAYVRSLSGLVRRDAAPGRSDNMSAVTPPSRMPTQAPQKKQRPARQEEPR